MTMEFIWLFSSKYLHVLKCVYELVCNLYRPVWQDKKVNFQIKFLACDVSMGVRVVISLKNVEWELLVSSFF